MVEITRKVISTAKETTTEQSQVPTKRVCHFCKSKQRPSYTDTNILRHFTTDRAKIVPRAKSYLCSKHQRGVAKEVKYARHLALLPFTPKV